MDDVLIFGLIVLTRTILSIALQLEVEECWPWQRAEEVSPSTLSKRNNEA
jgi:hypothetical protein